MPFIGRRYQLIDKLGTGGMGIVYRALDRLTGQQVALKQVTTSVEALHFGSHLDKSVDVRLALAQEFRMLASLRHPNIISVLDYGFDDARQPYYTMDLLRDSQTIVQAGHGQPLTAKIELLIQLLQSLVYLHRRGVIHRDLKPDNVHVIANHVKVLDFGLAMMRGDTPQRGDSLTGTLAYMAPELLRSEPASKASDLYAVGMMAYELLAGRHPFRTQSVAQLLEDIQFALPDMALIDAGADIKLVIMRLLAKDPAERIPEAADVIRLYAESTGQQAWFESQAIRESFLQAAQFVGREAEQRTLNTAVEQSLQGSGQAWLIGGESGVGKSRLIDQTRVLTLVQGAFVLRGQAITSGTAYHLWREPLRWLALDDSLSPLEAGVLKQIIPDIIVIRGEDIADAPVIDPQANQARLLTTIETILKRQAQPVLLIIEDLHWADSESLSVLTHLVRLSVSMRLLIIGSYRDDERPDLPAQLDEMRLMKLARLSEKGVAELCTAMLGAAGRNQQLVSFLSHETEGNAFFLVETVRALAEEAGELGKIEQMSLPQTVAAGGVQRIVQRRLSHVPAAARPLLELAAVIGRELDLAVLQTAEPAVDLPKWLNLCADSAILDVNDERWRFAHDKLREGTLYTLSPDRRRALHRQAAQSLEVVYPDRLDQSARLAFHWANAGDIDKERHYSAIAGEHALNSGAQQDAIRLLSRALELKIADPLEHSHLERCLSAAYYEVGDMAASQSHALATLQALSQPFPTSRSATSLATLTQLGRQVRYWLRPAVVQPGAASGRGILLEKSRAYERLAVANYMMSNSPAAVYSTLSALNLSERIGPSPELARNCVNTGMGLGLIRLHRPARYYLRRARQIAENSPATMRWVMTVTGAYYTGLGQWTEAYGAFRQAETIARDIGDVDGIEDGLIGQTCIHYARDEFADSTNTGWALYTSALRGDLQGQATGLSYCYAIWLQQGQTAKIKEHLDTLAHVIARSTDAGMRINGSGILSLAYQQQGAHDLAYEAAKKGLDLASALPPTSYLTILGYVSLTNILLGFWELGDSDQAANARQAIKALAQFARLFPFANPSLYRAQGLCAWLDGQTTQAVTLWQKGLAEAERLQMPYKAALIHYEIGRHLPETDPAHQTHLKQAQAVFDQMGAAADLALTREALA
jgi:tetratricopeptide (TPR) repeat protein/tRNA A-37 threonylcarbamoyl transferase component Bud32